MYAVTSLPFERRTRAIFRSAEFGFLGVMVLTCRQTPRFCGQATRSLTLLIRGRDRRGFLMSWLIVGMCFDFLGELDVDLDVDPGDFDAEIALAVTNFLVITLAALVL